MCLLCGIKGMKKADIGKIEFDNPAGNWNEALPIGNGRLGGMVFGM